MHIIELLVIDEIESDPSCPFLDNFRNCLLQTPEDFRRPQLSVVSCIAEVMGSNPVGVTCNFQVSTARDNYLIIQRGARITFPFRLSCYCVYNNNGD